jgi:hypothetical protein
MARRKKRKSYTKTRRRMSGVGATANIMDSVAVIGGAAAAGILSTKLFPTMNDKIKNAAVIALGVFAAPKLIKGSVGNALGMGMVAAGGLGLLKSFNVLSGVNDVLEIPVSVSGIDDNISVIAGNDDVVMAGDDLSVLAGMDTEEDYY